MYGVIIVEGLNVDYLMFCDMMVYKWGSAVKV